MKIDSAQICFVAFLSFTVNAVSGDWDDWDDRGSWLGQNMFGMNNRRASSGNSWNLWSNDDDGDGDDRIRQVRGSRRNSWFNDDDDSSDYQENSWNRGYVDDDSSDDDDFRWGRRVTSNNRNNRRISRGRRFDDDSSDEDDNGNLLRLMAGLRGQRNNRQTSNRRTVQTQQPMRNTWSNTNFLRGFGNLFG